VKGQCSSWPSMACTKSVGFAPHPAQHGQALLPAAPTLAQAPPIHKGKSLFTEQQYRRIQTSPQEKGASLLQGTAAAGKTHHPGKGHHSPPRTSAPHPAPCSQAQVRQSWSEPAKKQAGGQPMLCLPPRLSSQ